MMSVSFAAGESFQYYYPYCILMVTKPQKNPSQNINMIKFIRLKKIQHPALLSINLVSHLLLIHCLSGCDFVHNHYNCQVTIATVVVELIVPVDAYEPDVPADDLYERMSYHIVDI